MTRVSHGGAITVDMFRNARRVLENATAEMGLPPVAIPSASLQDFGYMFGALQNDANALLPESAATVANLKALGRTMVDNLPFGPDGDAPFAAIWTYFGQFVDHDITLETISAQLPGLLDPNLTPLPEATIRLILRNGRTGPLDLDSLYGFPAQTNGDKMVVGKVTELDETQPFSGRPQGKDDFNDLPRLPRAGVIEHDRAALIGDARNDENLIISQLHVAFLRAHNALIDAPHSCSFEGAQRLLRQHYQHIVLDEFLPLIADPEVVKRVKDNGPQFYDAMVEPFFMPLEFTTAAYRLGHSMVRGRYNFNFNFPGNNIGATLGQLFTFTALSGGLGFGQGNETLPENWIIEWEGVLEGPGSRARRLDTHLVEPLFALFNLEGKSPKDIADAAGRVPTETELDSGRLAVRNLLRAYLLRIPTGQAVAQAMGKTPLTPDQIRTAANDPDQVAALEVGGFLEKTPLWYYILAEAALLDGRHLGEVGSTILAEVFYGLVMRAENSILRTPKWTPTLPSETPGEFTLVDLLHLANVLEPEQVAVAAD